MKGTGDGCVTRAVDIQTKNGLETLAGAICGRCGRRRLLTYWNEGSEQAAKGEEEEEERRR